MDQLKNSKLQALHFFMLLNNTFVFSLMEGQVQYPYASNNDMFSLTKLVYSFDKPGKIY